MRWLLLLAMAACDSYQMADNPRWTCSCVYECNDTGGETLPVSACFHPAVLDDVQADMAQVCTAVLEQEGCVEPAVACECDQVADDCPNEDEIPPAKGAGTGLQTMTLGPPGQPMGFTTGGTSEAEHLRMVGAAGPEQAAASARAWARPGSARCAVRLRGAGPREEVAHAPGR